MEKKHSLHNGETEQQLDTVIKINMTTEADGHLTASCDTLRIHHHLCSILTENIQLESNHKETSKKNPQNEEYSMGWLKSSFRFF